jgi:hypothetical protein
MMTIYYHRAQQVSGQTDAVLIKENKIRDKNTN